jgi:hypothetical protein
LKPAGTQDRSKTSFSVFRPQKIFLKKPRRQISREFALFKAVKTAPPKKMM